jgi:hypothetical protein
MSEKCKTKPLSYISCPPVPFARPAKATRRPRSSSIWPRCACLFEWLVVGQVVRSNPASVGRGPRHVVNRGRTRSKPAF